MVDTDVKEYLISQTLEKLKTAEAEGFDIIKGDANHLLLDLDTEAQQDQYKKLLPVLESAYGTITEESRWPSKNGNLHVVVYTAHEFDQMSRIALQAALGSDPKRELLAVRLVEAGVEPSSFLFKPKQ